MIKTFLKFFFGSLMFFLFYTIAVYNHEVKFAILFGFIFFVLLILHLLLFATKHITG